jgi:hypothetical protein
MWELPNDVSFEGSSEKGFSMALAVQETPRKQLWRRRPTAAQCHISTGRYVEDGGQDGPVRFHGDSVNFHEYRPGLSWFLGQRLQARGKL